MDYFAVIDTETNWNNEVMSIGAVIAEKDTFKKVDDLYFIFDPEYKIGGMFSMVLPVFHPASKLPLTFWLPLPSLSTSLP